MGHDAPGAMKWIVAFDVTVPRRDVQLFTGRIREFLRVCENLKAIDWKVVSLWHSHCHGHVSVKEVVRVALARVEVAFTRALAGRFISEEPPARHGSVTAVNTVLPQGVTYSRVYSGGRRIAMSRDMSRMLRLRSSGVRRHVIWYIQSIGHKKMR